MKGVVSLDDKGRDSVQIAFSEIFANKNACVHTRGASVLPQNRIRVMSDMIHVDTRGNKR